MAKRKAAPEPTSDESELSTPPESLDDDTVALTNSTTEVQTEKQAVKKRKTARNSSQQATDGRGGEVETSTTPRRGMRTRNVKVEVKEEESPDEEQQDVTPRKRQRKTTEVKEEEAEVDGNTSKPALKGRTKKSTEVKKEAEDVDGKAAEQPTKKKRKTKEEKEAEAMPLAARTVGHKLFIGAHVSSAGGVQNAPLNSVHIGANAFALFLKSQRKWANPPLQPSQAEGFHANCKHHNYSANAHVVPHGSYLVNLAHTDPARTTQAYDAFLDDLQRCETLGIKLYNFHPGVANSTNGDKAKAIAHLASNLNRAHKATSTVVTLLENMAAAGGNVLGTTFEDLRDTIALIEDKTRVGVCLDTCHAFAAGYDLRSPEAFADTMAEFDRVVGFKYLRALHLNDSKAPFASGRDLHANIGTGFLGLRTFHNVVNEARFAGLPLVLETPLEVKDGDGEVVKDEKGKGTEDKGVWAREIKLLEGLVGMDVEGEEFGRLEEELARKGKPERERLEGQMERKREKEAKVKGKKGKGKGKGKKKGGSDEDGSESELSDVKSEIGE